ncbi:MAG: LysM peptidoglycan-binding domain-containing protein [Treponema sp.]|nr:LysM peptidoglycan-binding domain-containing protein [Candidatus Treponema equi]
MKSIGIKLADGSFYPLLEEGNPEKRTLDLTTVMDNQTKVQVEVYRTDTGTLEGAEYIDTLEIKNLKPHENGEPTLCLAIDVDENNELSAEIRDPETGKKSEIQVTLQSRTLAGIDNMSLEDEEDDVTISDDDLEKAGLDDFVEKKEVGSEEIPLPAEDFSFDEVNEPTQADDTMMPEENTIAETSEETTATEDDIFGENSLDLPEFGEEPAVEEEPVVEESVVSDDEADDLSSVDLPSFDESMFDMPEENSSEETAAENATEDSPSIEETSEEKFDDMMDTSFEDSFDSSLDESSEDTFAAPPIETTFDEPLEDTSIDEPAEEDSFSESFSLPDFDDNDDSTESETIEDLDLPDFDDLEATNLDSQSFDDSYKADSEDDFTLPPDFDEDPPKNPTFAPSTSMFSNLYDKETLEGTSGSYDYSEEEDKSNKTKAPMIICIICAIICIIAALLSLFVIPSKINLLSIFGKADKEEVVVEEIIEEEEEPVEEVVIEEVAPAQEDTIVIAETPAAVVPAEPEPAPEPIPDIRYKIIWGDTLWDISTAYYKTPWKYKKIAKYNKIRNPDHIIAGTYILIPAE